MAASEIVMERVMVIVGAVGLRKCERVFASHRQPHHRSQFQLERNGYGAKVSRFVQVTGGVQHDVECSSTQRIMYTRVEQFETIVIGGGQAGLSAGYHLAKHDVDFVILSDEARAGDNWRRRWDSLRLFTPAQYSGLPGMPFPAPPGHLADKEEMADYLERYTERFDLPIRLGTRASRLWREDDRFAVSMTDRRIRLEADNVIVATGAFQKPRIPAVALSLRSHIRQLHSSEYRNPFELPPGPVLVVGAGNSGAQIALELARYRKVWLAGRNTGHLPRRLLGRDIFDWLWPVMRHATADTRVGRRIRASILSGGDALVGIPERELQAAGIVRVGRLEMERDGLPVCGGTVLEPSIVIWCTGYAPDYSWIDLPIFGADGYPKHTRGVVSDAPGLYLLGLRFQHRLSSSLIGGVGEDAAFVAEHVASRREEETQWAMKSG
jgi:putative flavoprotein involved in K+ transport